MKIILPCLSVFLFSFNLSAQTFYPDLDGDTFGDMWAAPVAAPCSNCAPNNRDCDDAHASISARRMALRGSLPIAGLMCKRTLISTLDAVPWRHVGRIRSRRVRSRGVAVKAADAA